MKLLDVIERQQKSYISPPWNNKTYFLRSINGVLSVDVATGETFPEVLQKIKQFGRIEITKMTGHPLLRIYETS